MVLAWLSLSRESARGSENHTQPMSVERRWKAGVLYCVPTSTSAENALALDKMLTEPMEHRGGQPPESEDLTAPVPNPNSLQE